MLSSSYDFRPTRFAATQPLSRLSRGGVPSRSAGPIDQVLIRFAGQTGVAQPLSDLTQAFCRFLEEENPDVDAARELKKRLEAYQAGHRMNNEEAALAELITRKLDFTVFDSEHPLSPLPNGGVGKERFEALLRAQGVDVDADQLENFLDREFGVLEERMSSLARKIDPSRSWKEIYEDLQADYPEESKLKEAYRRCVEKTRDFTESHHIATVGETPINVVDTPEIDREWLPVAGFSISDLKLLITAPTGERHNFNDISVASVHEGIPGHMLEGENLHAAWKEPGNDEWKNLYRSGNSPFFREGWAVGMEKLFLDQGFYRQPVQQLVALRLLLFRCARALINVRIHTGKMTHAEAVDLFMNKLGMGLEHAVGQANHHFKYGYIHPSSYYLGMLQTEQLRKMMSSKPGFSLKEFHDKYLRESFGMPIPVAARKVFGVKMPPLDLSVGQAKKPQEADNPFRKGA